MRPAGNHARAVLTLATLFAAYILVERQLSSPIQPNIRTRKALQRPPVGWGIITSFLLLGGTVMASTMWFERLDQTNSGKQLVIEWDNLGHSYQNDEIPYRARTQLRYSKGKRTSWIPSSGTKATAYTSVGTAIASPCSTPFIALRFAYLPSD